MNGVNVAFALNRLSYPGDSYVWNASGVCQNEV